MWSTLLHLNQLKWPEISRYYNTVATLPCETLVTEPPVGEWCQSLPLAFELEKDILSTCCNKDDAM